jgi:hypothetical protein
VPNAKPDRKGVVMSDPHDHSNEFALVSATLGGLPIVNHILDRLGLPALHTKNQLQ